MARYIDEDNLLEKLHRIIDYCEKDRKVNAVNALFQVGDAIMDCKTADVQEVRYCKFELVQDGKGVCSNCHRLDSIDKLAKYCRYCGAFIKWEDDSNG